MQNPSENRALPRSKESLSLSLSTRPTTTALRFTKLQTVLANCNKYDDGGCAQCRHFWSYLLNKKGGKNRCRRENESGQPTTTVYNTRRRRRGETTTDEKTAVDLFSPASFPHTKQRATSFTTNGCCAKDLQQGTGAVADDKR